MMKLSKIFRSTCHYETSLFLFLKQTGEMEVKNPLFSEDSNNSAPPSGPADPVTTAADQSGK